MAVESIVVNIVSNIGKIAKDTDKATKSLGGFKGAIKGIGTALKASGIALLAGIMAKFFQLLSKNQTVIDGFNTTMNALNIVLTDLINSFGGLFNYINDNIGTVTGYFKELFDDPIQKLKDFGKAIKDNIIERVKSSIAAFGFLALAVSKVIDGDFAGAIESVKIAGKELVDVVTGVDDTFDKTVNTIKNVSGNLKDYANGTWNAAKATTALGKAVDKAASDLAKINLEFEKQAKVQQKIVDDEKASFADKKAALEELTRLTEENNEANEASQQLRVNQAQLDFNRNDSDANAIKLQEEKNKLTAIEAKNLAALTTITKKDTEITEKNFEIKLAAFSSIAGSLSSLAKDNKELAIASAIIDTYAGADKAFAVGGPAGFLTGAAIIAAGLANVQKIYNTPVAGSSGGSRGGAVAQPPAPEMMSGAFQLEGGQEVEPARAYVVSDDITNNQNKLAIIRRRATI